jgi:hypothetical protein
VLVGAFSIGLMKVATISFFSLMEGALEAALRRLTKREGRRPRVACSNVSDLAPDLAPDFFPCF